MSIACADTDGRATNHVSRQSASSSSSCSIAGHADQIIILQFIAATHGPAVGGLRTTHLLCNSLLDVTASKSRLPT